MGAKIRLQRKGAKNKPFFRVLVQDENAAPSASLIEILGTYDPSREPTVFKVNEEKTKAWLSKGAKPTEKVRILLGKAGIMEPIDLASLHKRPPKKEQKAAEGAEKPAEEKAEEKVEAPAEENKEA